MVSRQQQYKDANLTLKSLSQKLNTTTQALSMVINQRSGVNFNTYVNRYRVNEAMDRFNDEKYDHHTVASIAFDVGFNSISSFNSAFKKQTGKTPQEYRSQLTK